MINDDEDRGLDASMTFRLLSSEKQGVTWLAKRRSAQNLAQGGQRVAAGALVREAMVRMLRAEGWPEAMASEQASGGRRKGDR